MTIQNRIQGVITLTAPLHCSSGTEGNKTLTMKQPLITENGRSNIPYFPANDLRGRLRRQAAQIVVDALKVDTKISQPLLSGLQCGAVSASGENDLSVEEALRARENVYMGLFGGGTRLLRSGFKVKDMLPFIEETITAGIVPDYLGVNPPVMFKQDGDRQVATPLKGWQLVHEFQSIRVDDMYRLINLTMIEEVMEDPVVELSKYQLSVLGMRADKKEAKEKREAGEEVEKKPTQGLGNIMVMEAIAMGTQMHLQIDLEDHLTYAQRGLMLLSLRNLVNAQNLGGSSRNGCGAYKADLKAKFDDSEFEQVLVYNRDTHQYDLAKFTQPFVEAAQEEIAKLTTDSLWDFFRNLKQEKEAEKEKETAAEEKKKAGKTKEAVAA